MSRPVTQRTGDKEGVALSGLVRAGREGTYREYLPELLSLLILTSAADPISNPGTGCLQTQLNAHESVLAEHERTLLAASENLEGFLSVAAHRMERRLSPLHRSQAYPLLWEARRARMRSSPAWLSY